MKKYNVLGNESGNVMLNEDERKQMRESLLMYMEKVPVIPRDDLHLYPTTKKSRGGLIFGVLAGIAIASVGVYFAADHAASGNILYPVRTAVNDKIHHYFSHTQTANTASAVELTNSNIQAQSH